MANKPPAFQLYVKDWRSSLTVKRMTRGQRADYMELLIASWESDEPGTLPVSRSIICQICNVRRPNLDRLLTKFRSIFMQIGDRLVNKKLHDQYLKYKEISEKRSSAAMQMHSKSTAKAHANALSAVAVASAVASAITTKPKIKRYSPSPEFEVFWKAYPEARRLAKSEAYKAWCLVASNGTVAAIMEGLEAWKKTRQWQDSEFIPYPQKFLNKRRWENPPIEEKQRSGYEVGDLSRFLTKES